MILIPVDSYIDSKIIKKSFETKWYTSLYIKSGKSGEFESVVYIPLRNIVLETMIFIDLLQSYKTTYSTCK